MKHFFLGERELPIVKWWRDLDPEIHDLVARAAYVIIIVLMSSLVGLNAQTQTQPALMLHGEVRSASDSKPIEGASIRLDGKIVRTDAEGKFSFKVDKPIGKILIKHIGYQEQIISYDTKSTLQIRLTEAEKQIEEVISTGYQKIPKERATGSFEFIDSALFNRKVSTDLITRLEDVVPGMSRIKYYGNNPRTDQLNMNVRGISTIGSNLWPLVVIDGVPYENKMQEYGLAAINNINPNDVENITILKDAAAASIWGAQSGNGVIVITTKRGKFNEGAKLNFNSNITIVDKPDLYAYPQISSSDYIELQKIAYDKGRFNGRFDRWNDNVDPLIWLFKDATDKKITEAELETELTRLRGIDQRDDFLKYVYRKEVKQQHSLRLTQGGEKTNISFGLGYDRNLANVVTANYDRLNAKVALQIKPVKNLLLDIATTYNESKKEESLDMVGYNLLADGVANPPFLQLADRSGKPLKFAYSGYNPVFQDTVAGGRLKSYDYYPLEAMYTSKQVQKISELLMQLNSEYKFSFGLRLSGLYGYQRNHNPITNWRSEDNFAMRDQFNKFSRWDANTVIWNMPVGDYLIGLDWTHQAHQGRFNLAFDRRFADRHEVSFLAGFDVRELARDLKVSQYYGYNPVNGSFKSVPYGVEFRGFNGKSGVITITDRNRIESLNDRFRAYYANATYTFDQKYIWSGSFRKDASNMFGVKANERGQPFWSMGVAWLLSKESFLQESYFSYLKLRATYGYNGNINTGTSPLPTISVESQAHYVTGQTYGFISKPPNPNLRWERVGNINLGLDFGSSDSRFSGSIEYYQKRPKDLIAAAEVDPTVGFAEQAVNTANMFIKGWDISLNATPVQSENFAWNANLVFSYNRSKVTKAYLKTDLASFNKSGTAPIAKIVEGSDPFSLRTYRFAGLDPTNGLPQFYLNGEASKDYSAILNAKTSTLQNHGSQRPVYFGSLRNSLRYRGLELSWNISYQLGHKFLRETFSSDLFFNIGGGHKDYALRWQKPGDEAWTDIPAFVYPINSLASELFRGSSALVERADQIKLRDIQANFTMPRLARLGLKNFRIYAYVNNIGTIWQANKKGIDNEYSTWSSDPLASSLGLNFNF